MTSNFGPALSKSIGKPKKKPKAKRKDPMKVHVKTAQSKLNKAE